MSRPALGLIETAGLSGAIQATHAATKAGEVAIASAERTTSGHITVKIEGEWSVVQSAVEAGARAADATGELISMHVIPRTDNGVLEILPYRQFVARYLPTSGDRPMQEPARQAVSRPAPKRSKPKARVKPDPASRGEVEEVPAPAPPPAELPPLAERPAVEQSPLPPPVKREEAPAGQASPARSIAELEAMPVVKLRQYARTIEGLPIQGRQISMANKQQLLEAIREVLDKRA